MADQKQAKIVVRVQPNAKQDELLNFKDDILHLKIAAPPVKGKANLKLIKFLSEILGATKSNLVIEKGVTERKKVIGIYGLTQTQVTEKLTRLAKGKEEKKPGPENMPKAKNSQLTLDV